MVNIIKPVSRIIHWQKKKLGAIRLTINMAQLSQEVGIYLEMTKVKILRDPVYQHYVKTRYTYSEACLYFCPTSIPHDVTYCQQKFGY